MSDPHTDNPEIVNLPESDLDTQDTETEAATLSELEQQIAEALATGDGLDMVERLLEASLGPDGDAVLEAALNAMATGVPLDDALQQALLAVQSRQSLEQAILEEHDALLQALVTGEDLDAVLESTGMSQSFIEQLQDSLAAGAGLDEALSAALQAEALETQAQEQVQDAQTTEG